MSKLYLRYKWVTGVWAGVATLLCCAWGSGGGDVLLVSSPEDLREALRVVGEAALALLGPQKTGVPNSIHPLRKTPGD